MKCLFWELFDPSRCRTYCDSCRTRSPLAVFHYRQSRSLKTISDAFNGTSWNVVMDRNSADCDLGFSLHASSSRVNKCRIEIFPRKNLFVRSLLPYPPTFTSPRPDMKRGEWITKCPSLHRGRGIREYPEVVEHCRVKRVYQRKVVAKRVPGMLRFWTIRVYLLVIGEKMFVQRDFMWAFTSSSLRTNRVQNQNSEQQKLLRTIDTDRTLEGAVMNLTSKLCLTRNLSFKDVAVVAADTIVDSNNRAWLIEVNSFPSLEVAVDDGILKTKVFIWRDILRILNLVRGNTTGLDAYRRTCNGTCAGEESIYLKDNMGSFFLACEGRHKVALQERK